MGRLQDLRVYFYPHRAGTAVVEFAIALPLIVLFALATIDTCQVLYLKQSAKIAAYEGARTALVAGATTSDIETQCSLILQSRSVRGFEIELADRAKTEPGELYAVAVAVPADQNALVSSWFYRGRTFTEQVVVMIE